MKGLAPILLAVTICIVQAAPDFDGILGAGLLNGPGPLNLALLGGAAGNSQVAASQTITGDASSVNATPTGYAGPPGGNPVSGYAAPGLAGYGQTAAQSNPGLSQRPQSSQSSGGVGGGLVGGGSGVAPGLVQSVTG